MYTNKKFPEHYDKNYNHYSKHALLTYNHIAHAAY